MSQGFRLYSAMLEAGYDRTMGTPRRALIPAALAAALAACGVACAPTGAGDGGVGTGAGGAPPFTGVAGAGPFNCPDSGTPEPPLVHIGPDVSVEVPCAGTTIAPIGSLAALGGPRVNWTLSLDGDPAIFDATPAGGMVCGSIALVVTVRIHAPQAANVGDSFDATYTFGFPGGEAPSGKVTVHATVAAPRVTVEPAELDFGDVPEGTRSTRPITIRNALSGFQSIELVGQPVPFLFVQMPYLQVDGTKPLIVDMNLPATPAGTYAATAKWRAPATFGAAPPACSITGSFQLRARVIPTPDAGALD